MDTAWGFALMSGFSGDTMVTIGPRWGTYSSIWAAGSNTLLCVHLCRALQ